MNPIRTPEIARKMKFTLREMVKDSRLNVSCILVTKVSIKAFKRTKTGIANRGRHALIKLNRKASPMNIKERRIAYFFCESLKFNNLYKIIYVFLTIFLYLLKCPQSLILSALRAFCFCGKPHISRSIFLYFRYQAWLKSW